MIILQKNPLNWRKNNKMSNFEILQQEAPG